MAESGQTEVFYFRDQTGTEPALEFIDEVKRHNAQAAAKILSYIRILRNHDPAGPPLSSNYVKSLRGGIYELRPESGGKEYRVYFAWLPGRRAILLHACQKKPKKKGEDREIEQALENLAQYKERERRTR